MEASTGIAQDLGAAVILELYIAGLSLKGMPREPHLAGMDDTVAEVDTLDAEALVDCVDRVFLEDWSTVVDIVDPVRPEGTSGEASRVPADRAFGVEAQEAANNAGKDSH
jgi:hypothetical protein